MAQLSLSRKQLRALLGAAAAVVLLTVVIIANPGSGTATDPLAGEGDVAAGEAAFNATCAECHGPGAIGTTEGPTFLDPIYRPGHHADGSFLAAVRLGVREHHWPFGNMPPQDDLSNEDINNIVAYVRQLQVAAGIQ